MPYKQPDRRLCSTAFQGQLHFQPAHALYSVHVPFANAQIEKLKGSSEEWRDLWDFLLYLITRTGPSNIANFHA
jgi:hypothetical protein